MRAMTVVDVAVIGAGPAGSAAALRLARGGFVSHCSSGRTSRHPGLANRFHRRFNRS
jgi:thioredoxin reductase